MRERPWGLRRRVHRVLLLAPATLLALPPAVGSFGLDLAELRGVLALPQYGLVPLLHRRLRQILGAIPLGGLLRGLLKGLLRGLRILLSRAKNG